MLRNYLSNTLRRFSIYAKTSKQMFIFSKYLFITCFACTICLYYILSPWPSIIEDINYGKLAADQGVRIILESGRCSSTTNLCYKVFDAVDPLSNEVNRYLSEKHAGNDYESIVRLIPPRGIAFKHSDTRFWHVNHTFIRAEYVAVMLSAPFAVSSVYLNENTDDIQPRILIIGLGGGSMTSFMQQFFAEAKITTVEIDDLVVELAKKWFEVKETENSKIILADGVSYLKKAATSGNLYDVIMIDACGKNGKFDCPSDGFVTAETVNTLKRLITPTGVVVLNLLPASNGDEVVDKVIPAFLSVFPLCLEASLKKDMNYVLACLRVRQENRTIGQRLMSDKFQKVWHRFGFSQQFGTMEMLSLEAEKS